MISPFVSIAVVVADVVLAALLVAGIAYAARAERRPALRWIGAGAIATWFAVAFVLAKLGAYETTPTTPPPPPIVPAIAIPVLLGCALLALAPVRRAIARVPLQWLVGVQFYRVAGGLFLIVYLQGDIPGEFAVPAGVGDVLIGIAAPFVAVHLSRRGVQKAWPAVLAWCTVGILDLVVAVGTGFLTAPSTLQQLSLDDPNTAIVSYPLVLIPTFLVPVSILLHVLVIARLRARTRALPVARASRPREAPVEAH